AGLEHRSERQPPAEDQRADRRKAHVQRESASDRAVDLKDDRTHNRAAAETWELDGRSDGARPHARTAWRFIHLEGARPADSLADALGRSWRRPSEARADGHRGTRRP